MYTKNYTIMLRETGEAHTRFLHACIFSGQNYKQRMLRFIYQYIIYIRTRITPYTRIIRIDDARIDFTSYVFIKFFDTLVKAIPQNSRTVILFRRKSDTFDMPQRPAYLAKIFKFFFLFFRPIVSACLYSATRWFYSLHLPQLYKFFAQKTNNLMSM